MEILILMYQKTYMVQTSCTEAQYKEEWFLSNIWIYNDSDIDVHGYVDGDTMMVVVLVAVAENVKTDMNKQWINLFLLKNLLSCSSFKQNIWNLFYLCDCQACYHIILKDMYGDCKVLALFPFEMRKHHL